MGNYFEMEMQSTAQEKMMANTKTLLGEMQDEKIIVNFATRDSPSLCQTESAPVLALKYLHSSPFLQSLPFQRPL